MSQQTLAQRFAGFMASLPASESLDNSPLAEMFGQGSRADWLLNQRTVICEVKSLESDPSAKVQNLMNEFLQEPEAPLAYGLKVNHRQVLDHFKDGDAKHAQIMHAITRSIRTGVISANDQIDKTKQVLGLTKSVGFAVILNESVQILDPEVATWSASECLLRKSADGLPELESIDHVLIISETHPFRVDGRDFKSFCIGIKAETQRAADAAQIGQQLQKEWAVYNGVSYVNGEFRPSR